MSSDVERFYVRRSESLGPLLPKDVQWQHDEEQHVAAGDEWELVIPKGQADAAGTAGSRTAGFE